jgi:hypothetical protein
VQAAPHVTVWLIEARRPDMSCKRTEVEFSRAGTKKERTSARYAQGFDRCNHLLIKMAEAGKSAVVPGCKPAPRCKTSRRLATTHIQTASITIAFKLGAGWSSLVARRAHNPKVVGSNPTPARKNSK